MIINLLESIIFGLIIGLIYGYFFVEKLKRMYWFRKKQVGLQDKKILKKFNRKRLFFFILFLVFGNIFLILSFLFSVFLLHFNIIVVLIMFMLAFWGYVILVQKPIKIRHDYEDRSI